MNNRATSTPLLNSNKNAGSPPTTPSPARLTPHVRSPKYLIAAPNCGTPLGRPSLPMLSSTVNVSLYTNTQSPGLASRIVQYDRAQNSGNSATYNKKFGSPGLFPIVHLYKQSLPVSLPKPKRVTVKIAPPDDISMYNNRVEHSIIMSENARITKIHEPPTNGTRSVLDALKEISRKRIHSAAEIESIPTESGNNNRKRNKRILEANATPQPANATNKRAREESPTNTVNIPDKNTPKRYCSIDPITASFTSANLRFQEVRKDAPQTPEEYRNELPNSPLCKTRQVSVDTQTTLIIETNLSDRIIVETPINIETVKKRVEADIESPLFDPKPLEIIRRNKLAALLGAISGEVPILEKTPNQLDAETTTTIEEFPPITSILSKTTAKDPKHVTFDLPTPPPAVPPLMAITQTTTALIMPIPSTMVAPYRETTAAITSSSSVVSAHSFAPAINTPPKIVGGFKFDLNTPRASVSASTRAATDAPTFAATDAPAFAFPFVGGENANKCLVPSVNPVSFVCAPTATSTFTFGTAPISTPVDPPIKPFSFGAVSSPAAKLSEIAAVDTTIGTVPLFKTANMFQKPPVIPFQANVIRPFCVGTSSSNLGLFPSPTATKFDPIASGCLFTTTTVAPTAPSTTFSFGGGAAAPLTFGGTVDNKLPPNFGVAPAVTTTATTSMFAASVPFGTANFGGFAGGIKNVTHAPGGGVKFGDVVATTIANNPTLAAPTTTAQSLFSFGGTTATDIPKPPAFNHFADNSALSNDFGASKLPFEVGSSANPCRVIVPSFDNTPHANFNKSANFGAPSGFAAIAPPPTQTRLFSFGAATAIPKHADTHDHKTGGVFAFGTVKSNDAPTPPPSGGFNFAAGAGFGGVNVTPAPPIMFGAAQVAPTFNVGGFNAPAMVGGMFSIGSGSSSGPSRPRTQLKTKRRT